MVRIGDHFLVPILSIRKSSILLRFTNKSILTACFKICHLYGNWEWKCCWAADANLTPTRETHYTRMLRQFVTGSRKAKQYLNFNVVLFIILTGVLYLTRSSYVYVWETCHKRTFVTLVTTVSLTNSLQTGVWHTIL